MSDIDFQNGFICGMATRGLTKSDPAGDRQEHTIKGALAYGPLSKIVGFLRYEGGRWVQSGSYSTVTYKVFNDAGPISETLTVGMPSVSYSCAVS